VAIDPLEIRYADSDGVSIAYTVIGDGPLDLLCIPGFVSHLEVFWEAPGVESYFGRLASFSRVIVYDKRGQGLSDRPAQPPTLEQSATDARAVLDAAGSERAAVYAVSEGGPMSVLLAATHPDRVSHLALYGTWARIFKAPDYPEGLEVEEFERFLHVLQKNWGKPVALDLWAPSVSDDEALQRWWAKLLRAGTSRAGTQALMRLYLDIDVRPILPTIKVPTLVLHRKDDVLAPISRGRTLAEGIPGARFVELEGADHLPLYDPDQIIDEIEQFLTGQKTVRQPDRMLATVMFTDIVDSTARASRLGDRSWRDLIKRHDELMRREIVRHQGREVKTLGDGFLAAFDGPARAIHCACSARDAIRALEIEIRAGLHTGEVEVMGDDIGGIAVNIGARVGAAAGPGEVLVSRTVTDLVAGSGIDFADRGVHTLKGVPGEWQLYAVAANGGS
jgi:class 3 adenylate cyclase